MTMDDLPRILEIEVKSFPNPWTRAMFEAELRGNPFSRHLVALEEGTGRIIGYVVFWLMFDEAHVLNLAVDPTARKMGVGRFLVSLVVEQARGHRADRVLLEVRESNLAARTLYEHLGFFVESVRKQYYDRPREDAVILVMRLSNSTAA